MKEDNKKLDEREYLKYLEKDAENPDSRAYLDYITDSLVEDEQISSSHYLYPLCQKYNVKISKSNSSPAIYIFKNKDKFVVRIGHYMNEYQVKEFKKKYHHSVNYIYKEVPTYEYVESKIKKHLSDF